MNWRVWLMLFVGTINIIAAFIPGSAVWTAINAAFAVVCFVAAGIYWRSERKRKAELEQSHRDFQTKSSADYYQHKLYQRYQGNRITAAPAQQSQSSSDWMTPAALGYLVGASSNANSGSSGLSGGGGSFDGGGASADWGGSSSSSSDSGSSSSSDSGSSSSSDSGSSSSSTD